MVNGLLQLMVNILNGQWIMDNGLMITDGVMDGR
jgi:hypothetical protein